MNPMMNPMMMGFGMKPPMGHPAANMRPPGPPNMAFNPYMQHHPAAPRPPMMQPPPNMPRPPPGYPMAPNMPHPMYPQQPGPFMNPPPPGPQGPPHNGVGPPVQAPNVNGNNAVQTPQGMP